MLPSPQQPRSYLYQCDSLFWQNAPRDLSSIFVNNYCIKYQAMLYQCPAVCWQQQWAVAKAAVQIECHCKHGDCPSTGRLRPPSPSIRRHPLSYGYRAHYSGADPDLWPLCDCENNIRRSPPVWINKISHCLSSWKMRSGFLTPSIFLCVAVCFMRTKKKKQLGSKKKSRHESSTSCLCFLEGILV